MSATTRWAAAPVPRSRDRTLLWLSLVASTIPLGAGLVLIGADSQLTWLVVVAGTLVTGQLVLYNWTLGRLIRLLRVQHRLRSVYRVCITLGIAASPVGYWFVERWKSVAVLTGVTGAIILP